MTKRDFLFVPKVPDSDADKLAPTNTEPHAQFNKAPSPRTVPDELTVMSSPEAHKPTIFGALAFCLLAIIIMVTYQEMVSMIMSLLALGFFGPIAYFAWKRLNDPSPALVINSHGVFDNTGYCKVGLIPWDAIDDAVIHTVRGQQMLGITLVKGSRWETQLGALAKLGIVANRAMGLEPIRIPRAAITATLTDIQAVIRKHL